MSDIIQRALDAAIEAAREAGGALLAEQHRPDGPRGAHGKALVDVVAEDLIRARLTQAFPDFGFRAEERPDQNRTAVEGCPYTWLVDPHDGTSAFLSGFRGATVAIALLEDRDPVVGVVYAYSAPDDDGDLLAWARDCGPLTRNGVAVVHPGFPADLGPRDVVLISNAADRRPLINAQTVAPARYRPAPGIAYRLALVAAGEGVAAVSLFGSRDFDVAAGHALLMGVGGTLVDERGRLVRYQPDRSTRVGFCFGGGAEVTGALVDRDWQSVLATQDRERQPREPLEPRHAQPVDAATLARAQGCWLGQLCGDALGSHVEFQTAEKIAGAWPDGLSELFDGGTFDTLAGQPTDDSEMALMLARSLVASGTFDDDDVALGYHHWLDSHPFDLGNTVRQGLGGIDPGRSPAAGARTAANHESQANGALMRVSPIGIAAASLDPDVAADWAERDALLTHPNPICVDANIVFVAAIARAIRGGTAREVYDHALDTARGLDPERPAVANWLEEAADAPPDDFQTHQGWVRVALTNAFYQLLHAERLVDGIVDTVARGGDSDTNGAIAGALLGAVYGRTSVPVAWLNPVVTCRALTGLPGVRRPRPMAFWPIDALILPERLLCL